MFGVITKGEIGNEFGQSTTGLWKSCTSTRSGKTCLKVSCMLKKSNETSFCSKIQAARIFITLACILSGISTICFVIRVLLSEKITGILILAPKALAIPCLLIGCIGVPIGINTCINTIYGMEFNLGNAAIIGIIAVFMNFFGIIAISLIRR
ncbi:unnamed protein product [Rotaria magnacalcarata]|uniref:Uncharacterized protein n=1 Tax=Rotaria magnacalcarata TaxID=392030 RepID=A0A819CR37_9BILA|nr:unnamed protein product [Rotaria magnacalcarata]